MHLTLFFWFHRAGLKMKEITKALFRGSFLTHRSARLRGGLRNISILVQTSAAFGLGTGRLQRREEGSWGGGGGEAVVAGRARR